MDEQQAQRIAQGIIKDVFGRETNFSIPQLQEALGRGILLPEMIPCAHTGEPLYVYDPQPEHRMISETAFKKQNAIDDWAKPYRPMRSMDDVLSAWQEVNYMSGNKVVQSQNVEKSDCIITSSDVYFSTLINSCKNVVLSQGNSFSNYILACRDNVSCNFGIRVFNSIYCGSSYEVRWSNKVSRSMFIVDSIDLFECMFCYCIRSKKYCIANIQYEKEEYLNIKAIVIDWILDQWNHGGINLPRV